MKKPLTAMVAITPSNQVRLTVGVQTFSINSECESREHAEWMRDQLIKALGNSGVKARKKG